MEKVFITDIRETGQDYVRKEGSREVGEGKSEDQETKRPKDQRAPGFCREDQLGEGQQNTVPGLESSG